MDTLLDNFNVFKIKDDIDTFEVKFDNIFMPESNILDIYSYVRSKNIASDEYKISLLKIKTKDYMIKQLLLVNSINTCYNVLNDIITKLEKIRLLFDYIKNRKKSDLFTSFIEDFYTVCVNNKDILIEYIFKPLVDPKMQYNNKDTSIKSFKLLINYLNYSHETNLYLELYNKFTTKLISFFTNTIKTYLTSDKTLNYFDLVNDFKLIKENVKYEKMMSEYLTFCKVSEYLGESKMKTEKILSSLPILKIVSNINIYSVDVTFFDIIKNVLENRDNPGMFKYLMNLVENIESSIIITKEKYASEKLIIDISKIFRIYNNMIIHWSSNGDIIGIIKDSINNILSYDDILMNYIVTSLIIFGKKINNDNFNVLKDLTMNIANNIAISNKDSEFLDIFYQNLQNNLLKSKIKPELIEYIKNIIEKFDNTNSNFIKIQKFLCDIEINIDYNYEISNAKIKCNKSIPINMNICNTILINKNTWKNKNIINSFKIPDEIAVYFKTYEQFYNIKHNYRSIEWSMEHSTIDIEINNKVVTGSILPISILILIGKHKNINYEDLLKLLKINDIQNSDLEKSIKNNIILLESNNIIKLISGNYTLLDIITDVNLNKLSVLKNKSLNLSQEHSFDIDNSTDCYLIKLLKPLNGDGLSLLKICKEINNINKYFQATEELIKTRLDILISKNYITFKNDIYYYDV
jgi:hypothetical protein